MVGDCFEAAQWSIIAHDANEMAERLRHDPAKCRGASRAETQMGTVEMAEMIAQAGARDLRLLIKEVAFGNQHQRVLISERADRFGDAISVRPS